MCAENCDTKTPMPISRSYKTIIVKFVIIKDTVHCAYNAVSYKRISPGEIRPVPTLFTLMIKTKTK